jgi:hypothetical protein
MLDTADIVREAIYRRIGSSLAASFAYGVSSNTTPPLCAPPEGVVP